MTDSLRSHTIVAVPLSIDITLQPWFQDHRFAGKTILPAVETIIILASEVKRYNPACMLHMTDARFGKFLELPADAAKITVIIEISRPDNNQITAVLLTRKTHKKITRLIEHGRLTFVCDGSCTTPLKRDSAEPAYDRGRTAIDISARRIYAELVPFGKAYQNIIADLHISEGGAWGKLQSPELPLSHGGLLGSPFPLDAAMHAACVWGQRFMGFIPFPVGFSTRIINKLTKPGKIYTTKVVPTDSKPDEIIFDLWIFDEDDNLCETLGGIKMRDVSGGRLKPPDWLIFKG